MTNKEIFALATDTARKLKAQGLTNSIPKAKQTIYDNISPILQKVIQPDKMDELVSTTSQITDEELRAKVKAHLIERLNDKTLQAAEIAQLKDIFGLSRQSDDVNYTVLDFSETLDSCRQCGENPWKEKLPDLAETTPSGVENSGQ